MPALTGEQEKLAQSLRSTHEHYIKEQLWHRFLLDAYAGTGGFEGRVRQPISSFWGPGADDYAIGPALGEELADDETKIDTYLDRFPREDVKKFARRVAVSMYPNYCEPITDIRLSYMNRKPMTYAGIDALAEGEKKWLDNVGRGLSWDAMMGQVARLRALVLGWFPMLVDAPRVTQEISVAQAQEAGMRARLIPLFPSNLLDWRMNEDTGEWLWAKVRTCYDERLSPFSASVRVERITVWTAMAAIAWEIRTTANGDETLTEMEPAAHGFGKVPLVVFRAKPAPNDMVRGLSIIGAVARMNKKLFNYLSEFDEHIRSCVFAMLEAPVNKVEANGVVVVGAGNVLPIPYTSTREHRYVTPDSGVATSFESRIEKTIGEIHRVGREQSGGAKQVAKSGVASAYDFENTNRAISDNAASFALAELETLKLVLRVQAPQAKTDEVRVTPATRFDVEEMAKELEEALTAVDLDLGTKATSLMKQRLVRKLLPNLTEKELTEIDGEIEERAKLAEQERAAMMESMAAVDEDGDPADPEDAADEKDDAKDDEEQAPPKGTPRPGERVAGKRTPAKKAAPRKAPAKKGGR